MKRSVMWTLASTALLLSIAGLVYWDYTNYLDTPVSSDEPKQVRVVIPRGLTLTQAVELLENKGLVTSPSWFKVHLLLSDLARSVKAGGYYFSTAMTPRELANMLAEGPHTAYLVLTIKEGFNIWQVADAFEAAGVATKAEVLDLLADPSLATEAGIPEPAARDKVISPVEGFIFPETYYVAPGQSLRSILLRMIRQTFKELVTVKKKHLAEYSAMLEEIGLSDYEIVTLASLVERETPLKHEKKLVASVFKNRLQKKMPLQSDPTLTYTRERRGARPLAEDRKNETNPYNTYLNTGLPPGPICNPGRDALAAVVATPHTDFLYFVAKNDGSGGHYFTTNYDDHRRAVQRYLKKKKGK